MWGKWLDSAFGGDHAASLARRQPPRKALSAQVCRYGFDFCCPKGLRSTLTKWSLATFLLLVTNERTFFHIQPTQTHTNSVRQCLTMKSIGYTLFLSILAVLDVVIALFVLYVAGTADSDLGSCERISMGLKLALLGLLIGLTLAILTRKNFPQFVFVFFIALSLQLLVALYALINKSVDIADLCL